MDRRIPPWIANPDCLEGKGGLDAETALLLLLKVRGPVGKKSLTTTNAVSALLRLKHMTRLIVDIMIARTLRAARVDNVTSRGVTASRSVDKAEQCSFTRGSQEAAGKD